MRPFKKFLRTIGLIVLLLLAVMGVALVPIFPREEPMSKRTSVELIKKRKLDDEDELH